MRIALGSKGRRLLKEEFETTKVTVISALKHETHSYLARKIRERAKELLKEEYQKTIEL